MAIDELLNLRGQDVFPSSFDHVFQPATQGEVTAFVDHGPIPCLKKSFIGEHLCIFFRHIVITGEDGGAFNRQFTRQASVEKRLAPKLHWSVSHPPLHARALVLTGETLFVAGPPDVLNEDEAYKRPNDPQVKDKILEQDAAYEGKYGALLMGVSTVDGSLVLRLDLLSEPVWDGMIAANGRLYLSTKDGKLHCFDKQ